MDHDARQERNVEHARWRVAFSRSLLESHRMVPLRGAEWAQKEAVLLERLAGAEAELRDMLGGEPPGK